MAIRLQVLILVSVFATINSSACLAGDGKSDVSGFIAPESDVDAWKEILKFLARLGRKVPSVGLAPAVVQEYNRIQAPLPDTTGLKGDDLLDAYAKKYDDRVEASNKKR